MTMRAADAGAGRVGLTGSGWDRGGVEGALLAAGYTVVDVADRLDDERDDRSDGQLDGAARVDAVVAVGDDLEAVASARALGVPCLVVRAKTPDVGELVETVMVGADGVVTGATSADEFL